MPTESIHPDRLAAKSRVWTCLSTVVLAATALLAWSNTFQSPFIFDDDLAIVTNERLHHFWPPWRSAWAPPDTTLAGRPVPAFTFALNHAVHGFSLPGYHAVNLLVHVLAALALFAVVRRTLLLPSMRKRFGGAASPIALTVALLWLLHPLTTQSVTYIVRRVESMMGLFFFLTVYAAIRAFESPGWRWRAAAAAACALGMGTLETMAVAPVVVLLYDRAFVSGGWKEALRRHTGLYAGLASSWLVVLLLQIGAPRGAGAGFHLPIAAAVSYLRAQTHFILRYLLLVFRPWGLVLDYGTLQPNAAVGTALEMTIVAALAVAVILLVAARPRWGFLPAVFFLVLAPSSSVIPIPVEVAAENRMYVPLAAAMAGVTVFGFVSLRWLARRISPDRTPVAATITTSVLVLAAAGLLGGLTYTRNKDYQSELAIETDTVTKVPGNSRAWSGKGNSLNKLNRPSEALGCFDKALEIDPQNALAWYNKGNSLNALGRPSEALACFDRAIEFGVSLGTRRAAVWTNKGNSLNMLGRPSEAIVCLDKALEIDPRYTHAWINRGVSLGKLGRPSEAIPCFDKAIEIQPRSSLAWFSKAVAYEKLGDRRGAIRSWRTYLEVARDDPTQAAWIPRIGARLRELENR